MTIFRTYQRLQDKNPEPSYYFVSGKISRIGGSAILLVTGCKNFFFQLFLLPQELDLPSPGGIHYGFKTDVITFYNSPCGRAHLSRLVPPPNVRFSPPQTWSNRSEQDRPKHSISSPANGNIQIKHYAALTVLWSRSRRRSRKKTGGFGSSSIDLIICSVV